MNVAFLGLGGNMGNRLENLSKMVAGLKSECGDVVKVSGIYETEVWGSDSRKKYLNQVVKILTPLSALGLLEKMLVIEKKLGRVREEHNLDRTADLDILFFNDAIIHSEELQVPHPRLHLRKFVLIPLTEIEPALFHPKLKETIKELLKNCKDDLTVESVKIIEN